MAFKLENIPVQTIKPKPRLNDSSILKKEMALFKSTFSNKVKEDFYLELSVLLKAGVNLREALELLEKSQKKSQNKAVKFSKGGSSKL